MAVTAVIIRITIICHLKYCHSLLTGPFLACLSLNQIFLNWKPGCVTSLIKTLHWVSTACKTESKPLPWPTGYSSDVISQHLTHSRHTDLLLAPPAPELPGDACTCSGLCGNAVPKVAWDWLLLNRVLSGMPEDSLKYIAFSEIFPHHPNTLSP